MSNVEGDGRSATGPEEKTEERKDDKHVSSAAEATKEKKKYIYVHSDQYYEYQMKKLRVDLGLPPDPPLIEVKEEQEMEPSKDLSFAPEVSSSASSSSISTTVLTSTADYDLSKGLVPGRVEGQLDLIGHKPLRKGPLKPGAVQRDA